MCPKVRPRFRSATKNLLANGIRCFGTRLTPGKSPHCTSSRPTPAFTGGPKAAAANLCGSKMTYCPVFQNGYNVSELLESGVALDEFLGAASREANADAAILILAFHADHGADAILRMANFSPQ